MSAAWFNVWERALVSDNVKILRRPAYSWAQHLIELLVTVFLVGALTNSVMYQVLRDHGLPRNARRVINNITTGIIASTVLLLNARRLSRRADSSVSLTREGLSIRDSEGTRRVPYHDVAQVSVAPAGLDAQCFLHLAEENAISEKPAESGTGRRDAVGVAPRSRDSVVGLPLEVASFTASRRELQATLVSQLADEFGRLLESGAIVHFQEERARAGKHMLQAIVGFVTGIVGALLADGVINGATHCAQAVTHFRRGWRGCGVNFYVDREGVWLPPFTAWDHHSWQDLIAVQSDAAGIVLKFDDGLTLSMSPFADHFWPFAVWIERHFEAIRPLPIETAQLAPSGWPA